MLQRRFGFGAGLRKTALKIGCLSAVPLTIGLVSVFGPLRTDAVYSYSGIAVDVEPGFFPGLPTIDGNMGITSQSLGIRGALDVAAGRLPLWNHYEGLGTPLLGEMQSAALFPPTWLMLLPHGQALEQALLQWLAGVGAYLFFRKFGLGTRASLAGSIVFEVNGVFAWLRNAIFNPVPFLPWLFLVVEGLLAEDRLFERRLPWVCLGGIVAALALYAGFPEEVYLYGLLLAGWTVFRLCALSYDKVRRVLTDLILTALVGAALSAPLLVCFVDYLRVAELGSHAGEGFAGVWLNAAAIVQYIMPYVYGPIFASPDPTVYGIWSGTGGYVGFVPLVLSVASLLVPDRRSTKLVLAAWIVLALGVTHGVPGLYDAFMRLPLTKTAAVFRYLNASWIFCFVFLSALFLDDMSRLAPRVLKRCLGLAIGSALLLTALAVAAAWPVIGPPIPGLDPSQIPCLLAVVCVGLLTGFIGWPAARHHPERRAALIAGAMVLEALIWFAVPYLSYPSRGHLDLGLVSFLRNNVGFQRVLGVDASSLYPNYGSAFEIALLNYDDLPSPGLTAAYVKANVDPAATGIAYPPVPYELSEKQQARRLKRLHSRLAAVAQAGVKFVLGSDGFQFVAPYDVGTPVDGGYALPPGKALDVRGHVDADLRFGVSAVSVRLDKLDATASGHLKAALCIEAECVEGLGDLAAADADRWLSVAFDRQVTLKPGAAYALHIARVDGDGRVALPGYRLAPAEDVVVAGTEGSGIAGEVPEVRFSDADVRMAYSGSTITVYELSHVRAYLSADGCSLEAPSRESVTASCSAPAKLIRLEAALPGWSALVNGVPTPVTTVDDAFQAIDLPAGGSHIEFSYWPNGLTSGFAAAGATLVSILLAAGWLAWRPSVLNTRIRIDWAAPATDRPDV